MTNVKKVLLMSACLCVGQSLTQVSLANTSTIAPPATLTDESKNAQSTQAMLSDIITDESYSHAKPYSEWVRKNPPVARDLPEGIENVDLSWIEKLIRGIFGASEAVGVFGKTVAILFLVLLAWWLYRTRDYWLSWVERLAPMMKRTPQISHAPHIAQDVWAELPPSDELVAYVQKLLQQGEYLLALSVLYRGTLRELNAHHALAIDKHQTEDECVWLLAKSPATPQESAYFGKLVALWRACAYGKALSDEVAQSGGRPVHELTESWSALYGQRG